MQGQRPLIMDLKTTDDDVDHIVTLFKQDGFWGAITKTNHAVLRYREPIYRNRPRARRVVLPRVLPAQRQEDASLVFRPVRPRRPLDGLDHVRREPLGARAGDRSLAAPRAADASVRSRGLRRADAIEIEAGELKEWRRGKRGGLRRDLRR